MRLKGSKLTKFIVPMLATAVDAPFDSTDWVFELKLDGYRAIAELSSPGLLLYSRNGLDLTTHYPAITDALKKIKKKLILDGEIVLLDKKGKPDFQRLQNHRNEDSLALVYYVFDILRYGEKDLTNKTLIERKEILKKVLPVTDTIRYSEHIDTDGKKMFKLIKSRNMEGIMAKKKDSLYTPGLRTKAWLKIKHQHSQEAVIIGYTEPRGSRTGFGSLLLAQYKKNALQYIGHAGTGFTQTALDELKKNMKAYETNKKPIDIAMKGVGKVTWLRPKLVCEVGYAEITKEGMLRHPVFKGLRTDKKNTSVKQETEQEASVENIIPQPSKKKKQANYAGKKASKKRQVGTH